MYPQTIDNTEVIGYIFPRRQQITLSYNNQPVATRIQYSYIQSVNVTYNPSSMGWHLDGQPSEVVVTVVFVEDRTLDKADIEAGF